MDFNVNNYLSTLSYINKEFPTLWNEILETVPKLTNKWIPSEANESDPLVVLLKELAIFTDKLNYNIDKNILELFPATLTQLRSAYNVYESLGYTPDWYVSATTNITIIYNGLVSGSLPETSQMDVQVTIPRFTQVSDEDSETVYTLLEPITISVGRPSRTTVLAIEGTLNDFEINGSTQIVYSNLDSQNRLYFTQTNIAQNGILINTTADFSSYTYLDEATETDTGDLPWTRVDNLNQYTSGSYVYKLGVDNTTNSVYLQFPDDMGTLIGDGIYIKYVLSAGEQGNVGRGDISKFLNITSFSTGEDEDAITLSATDDFTITNTQSSQNGSDPLDIEEMRTHFNRVVGVFDTLVTLRDYENYIYEYTYPSGNNAVSNIRVSDRYTDLYDSLTYKYMTTAGVIENSTVAIEEETTGGLEPVMTAYDLKLYPLAPASPVTTRSAFDTTFNEGVNLSDLNDSIVNEETGILVDSKCISHDFTSPGTPIFLPYDLNGQIYLQTAVSSVEAANILSEVEQQIYLTLNSRQLEWGEMLDYGTVVENLKAADSRIQYVALDAIAYEQPQLPAVETTQRGYDVTVRTILAGNKAWTDYNPYNYAYNQTNGQLYGNNSGGTGINNYPVSTLRTNISIEGEEEYNLYVVGPNETFTILVPQYNTSTTYGNYLYFIAQGSGSISANVPTEIPAGCSILIFNTRTKAQEYVANRGSVKADYTINAGTIIQASVDITFVTSTSISESSIQNMGSSTTINVLERATGVLNASNNLITTASSGDTSIRISTNSLGLINALNHVSSVDNRYTDRYTLLSGEYLFYTDVVGLELGIIGEGTTLYASQAIPDIYYIDNSADITTLLNGGTTNNYLTTWTNVSSGMIHYELNEMYTLGADYAIRCSTATAEPNTFENFISNVTPINEVFDFNSDIKNISYGLVREDGTITWESLPSISTEDTYQGLIRLALITGPSIEQELHHVESQTVEELVSPARSQSIVLQVQQSDTSPLENITIAATEEANLFVQSSLLVTYQGGATLSLNTDEKENLNLYVYQKTGDVAVSETATGFINLSDAESPYTLTVPGSEEDLCVMAYTTSNNTSAVMYLLIKGGTAVDVQEVTGDTGSMYLGSIGTEITNILTISSPYSVRRGATYYNPTSSSYENISTIIEDGVSAKILTEEHLYYNSFCPLYTPTDEENIADPTNASSYFLKQHPYNKYVMPRLNNINITISPLSITR